MDIAFTHLHVHSHFSILDGMAKIPDLVDKCLRCGMNSIALTDHGNMFGIKEFYDYCVKVNKKLPEDAKFKPIFGTEAYCAPISLQQKESRSDYGWHLIILAKNKKGYENLCKLCSIAYIDGFYYNPRIDHSLLEKYHEGLIVCSACLGGEVPQKIMKGDIEGAEKSILWFKKIFGDDYYLELQRHKTDKPNASTDVYKYQCEVNEVLVRLAAKTNTKIIATNDVHFVEEEHGEAHDRLICLSTGKDFNDPNRMHYTKQEWLKTPDEMAEIFADLPEALLNTQEIVDKVEPIPLEHAPIMPVFPIPEEFGTVDLYRQKFTEKDLFDEFTQNENHEVVLDEEKANKKIDTLGGYDRLYRIKLEADYLAKLTWEGAKLRYPEPFSNEVVERINFELHVMKTMGFPGYFLIVQDYIRGAREELGVAVGPGRGSAAGSVVAYCLKITDLDPLKYDLLFERFLNPDRISLPDIDVDFEDWGRPLVLDWVTKKYGKEKVAHIITYGTMAAKSSIADVCRVQKVPLELSNKLKSFIPDKEFDDSIIKADANGKKPKPSVANCIKLIPELKQYYESEDTNVASALTYASQLEGTNRQIGIHACGVIIGADDLMKFAPLCTIKDKETKESVVVTQYEGQVVEDVGLIKMDFLGLTTLTIIKDALANIKRTRGIDLDIDHITLEDKETYELFSAGNTIGVFQFDSPGMQKSLRDLKPSNIGEIIAMNALYRPGPMDNIPVFVARKYGRQPITYDFKCMSKYLEDTYGITVYQEQVMLLSRELANFTRGESDTLRKAMGKKKIEKMEELYSKFIKQGVEKLTKTENLPEKEVEDRLNKIWNEWKKFASYAFNKSHAACYSWLAYQTAYLKTHYPEEFMAAVLNNFLDNPDKFNLNMDDCKRMHIEVLGPDINESQYKFIVNDQHQIRYGLGAIKGLGEAAIQCIVKEREANGAYTSYANLLARTADKGLTKKIVEYLASAGALDCFKEMHRAAYFFSQPNEAKNFIEKSFSSAVSYLERKNAAQLDLFGGGTGDGNNEFELQPPQCERWGKLKELQEEKNTLGFYISAHPLDVYSYEVRFFTNTTLDQMPQKLAKEGATLNVAGFVTKTDVRLAKSGNSYGIYTIEDKNGSFEFRLFTENFMRFSSLLQPGTAVLISGIVKKAWQEDKPNEFKINDVQLLETVMENSNRKLKIYLDINDFYKENSKILVNIIKKNKGKQNFDITLIDKENRTTVPLHATAKINARDVCKELDNLFFVSYDFK